MAHRIAFINQKGGVGKTTLVANCGAYWARKGYRVLVIDLDPQAHLTLHLGTAGEQEEFNLYRVLRGDIPIDQAIVTVVDEQLDVLPSHIDLSAAEWEFGQEVGRETLLRDQLRFLDARRAYDLILMDCPPSLGFLSLNALAAVDDVVIPVQAEFFALQGMAQLLKVVDLIRDRLHPVLKMRAIVPTLVDLRTNLGREVIADLQSHFPGLVTKSLLSKRVKVAEAPSFGQSIFVYAGNSEGAEEFAGLAEELTRRLEIRPPEARESSAGQEARSDGSRSDGLGSDGLGSQRPERPIEAPGAESSESVRPESQLRPGDSDGRLEQAPSGNPSTLPGGSSNHPAAGSNHPAAGSNHPAAGSTPAQPHSVEDIGNDGSRPA